MLLQGTDRRELGRQICEQVVPRRPKDTPILVKPNLGGFDWFQDPDDNDGDDGFTGRTTHPDFTRGVIACLKARGHTRITIADGWSASTKHWPKLVEETGYRALAEEMSVDLIALADDGHYDTIDGEPGKPLRVTGMERTRVPNLLMPKILAEHLERGLVISVPKLKAHRFAVMSGGIKGMQGTIMLTNARPAYQQKWRMHAELKEVLELKKNRDPKMARAYVDALNAFAARLTDVLLVEAPHVVLLDAAPAMNRRRLPRDGALQRAHGRRGHEPDRRRSRRRRAVGSLEEQAPPDPHHPPDITDHHLCREGPRLRPRRGEGRRQRCRAPRRHARRALQVDGWLSNSCRRHPSAHRPRRSAPRHRHHRRQRRRRRVESGARRHLRHRLCGQGHRHPHHRTLSLEERRPLRPLSASRRRS